MKPAFSRRIQVRETISAARRKMADFNRRRIRAVMEEEAIVYRSADGLMVTDYTISGDVFLVSKPRLWAAKKGLGTFDLCILHYMGI